MPQKVASLQEYFQTVHDRFLANEATGVNAVYQFDLAGDGGGSWYIEITDGALAVHEGQHPKPNTSYKMAADQYLKLVNGELNGRMAVLTGKLKVTGSIPSAYKMQKFLPTS